MYCNDRVILRASLCRVQPLSGRILSRRGELNKPRAKFSFTQLFSLARQGIKNRKAKHLLVVAIDQLYT
ncbi:hypothetical protein MPSEU_000699000 [Mayamaea pseudoterrestris]|nr:hypothetical protein MPSEU_000699000 [Mayamaea pseudoterrestris]